MAKENPFQRAISSRKQQQPDAQALRSDAESNAQALQSEPVEEVPVQPEPQAVQRVEQPPEQKEVPTQYEVTSAKKRGRPATGKRSDANWIGRTFYIQKETDFDVEAELLDIKRQGIELDKSELVERLLAAWVKWRNGENSDIQMFEISPRRKSN